MRLARKLDRGVGTAIRHEVAGESGYRELGAKAGREKDARRAGRVLVRPIRVARQRLDRALAGDFARATMKRDARDVSRRLRTVHQRADDLTERLSHGSLDSGLLAPLHVRHTSEERKKQYTEIRAALRGLEKAVDALVRAVGEREKKFKAKQRRYLKDGQARYKR